MIVCGQRSGRTVRQGAEAHLRMLEAVACLQRGQDVPVVAGHLHKTEISARLGC